MQVTYYTVAKGTIDLISFIAQISHKCWYSDKFSILEGVQSSSVIVESLVVLRALKFRLLFYDVVNRNPSI